MKYNQLTIWFAFFFVSSSNPNRMSNSSSIIYRRRSISAGISRSLNVKKIKERIDQCKIVSLFRDESLEAGYILNILYNLDKISDMKMEERQLNNDTTDMEELFMMSFWEEIQKFRIERTGQDDQIDETKSESIIEHQLPTTTSEPKSIQSDEFSEMDTLLSMAFNQCIAIEETNDSHSTCSLSDQPPTNCFDIYER